mmetsp:Transcript_48118/g.135434  ORF Transcript_48118/g.135434 Transcript_48118/m.135434 type:complete len:319 (-) Transcript_48118:155-1111(-)
MQQHIVCHRRLSGASATGRFRRVALLLLLGVDNRWMAAALPPPAPTMRLIGAGLPNTGTQSLAVALQELGFEPCHGVDFWLNTTLRDAWSKHVFEGGPIDAAVRSLLDAGFDSNLDAPTMFAWRGMVDMFPDAKVVLTVRDTGEKWYDSITKKMRHPTGMIEFSMKWIAWYSKLDYIGWWRFLDRCQRKIGCSFREQQTLELQQRCIQSYEEHVDIVKRTVPADRLLVFNVKQGWAPLCKFLGLPVPDRPFPKRDITKGLTRDVFKDLFEEKYQANFRPLLVLCLITLLWWTTWCCVCRRLCRLHARPGHVTKHDKPE